MTDSSYSNLSAGKALTNPESDKLGYRSFAQVVAHGLHAMSPADGFVVAIYGPWGAGKSSFVNFIIHYLTELPEQDQPLVVTFNPWWFSGQEDLAARFFQFLIGAIVTDPNKARNKKLKKVAEHITKYASKISVPVLKDVAALANEALQDKVDVYTLKRQVEAALADFEGRILVVIDDIDRLTAGEIRQLFRLVKAVADFPKILYLLAFDRRVVVNALQAPPVVSGDDYLEKIVQASFELPIPSDDEMEHLLLQEMEQLRAQTPTELRNQMYWDRIWGVGLSHFVKTPRHVVRLANAMRVTYPPVAQEVNSEDFVTMEALRLFCPNAYDFLRRHKANFVGQLPGFGVERRTKELMDVYEEIGKQVVLDDRAALQHVLRQVFPLYESIVGSATVHWFDEPLAHLRVAYPDAFDVYFHLRLPTDRLHHSEMKSLIAKSEDVAEFSTALEELLERKDASGKNQAEQFLGQLQDYMEAPSFSEHAANMLRALVQSGDTIVNASFNIDTTNIAGLVFMLLHHYEGQDRTAVLREAMEQSSAVGTLVSLGFFAEYEHGLRDNGRPLFVFPLVYRDSLDDLRASVLNKVRASAHDGSLLNAADLRRILLGWQAWAGEQEVREWAMAFCADDQNVLDFLWCFVYSRQLAISDKVIRHVGYMFDMELCGSLVDVPALASRAEILSTRNDLSEHEQIALATFLKAVQKTGAETNEVMSDSDVSNEV